MPIHHFVAIPVFHPSIYFKWCTLYCQIIWSSLSHSRRHRIVHLCHIADVTGLYICVTQQTPPDCTSLSHSRHQWIVHLCHIPDVTGLYIFVTWHTSVDYTSCHTADVTGLYIFVTWQTLPDGAGNNQVLYEALHYLADYAQFLTSHPYMICQLSCIEKIYVWEKRPFI